MERPDMAQVADTLEALLDAERSLKGAHKTPQQTKQRGRAATRLGAVQTARPYEEGVVGAGGEADASVELPSDASEEDQDEDGLPGEAAGVTIREMTKKSRESDEPQKEKKSYTWAASRQDIREHYLGEGALAESEDDNLKSGKGSKIKTKGKDKLASSYIQFDG
jgi:hypothetical protein